MPSHDCTFLLIACNWSVFRTPKGQCRERTPGKHKHQQHHLSYTQASTRQTLHNGETFCKVFIVFSLFSMSCQNFVSERVFPSTSSATPEGIRPEMLLPSAEVQKDLLSHKMVCFLGHSIVDDLRILLEEKDSDLSRDFNLNSSIPMWKGV